MEASIRPLTTAQRSLAYWNAPCIREGRTPRGIPRVVVFSDSHTSVESTSRAPRAFSRAVCRAPAIEEGFWRSVTRRSRILCTVRSEVSSTEAPKIEYTSLQAVPTSCVASSVMDCSDTSRIRAVWSARST